MGNLGLVREKEMTGAIEQDELCLLDSALRKILSTYVHNPRGHTFDGATV